MLLLTSFTKSAGVFKTEEQKTSLEIAKFLTIAIRPKMVRCLICQMLRTFLSLASFSSKFNLIPALAEYGKAIPSAVT